MVVLSCDDYQPGKSASTIKEVDREKVAYEKSPKVKKSLKVKKSHNEGASRNPQRMFVDGSICRS
jgi:hypothetical protein